MARRAARIDKNQPEIVRALRAVGASVCHLHTVGTGVPDIAVGYGGVTYLLEIKSAEGELTPAQVEWHDGWRGHVCVVSTIDEALEAIGVRSIDD